MVLDFTKAKKIEIDGAQMTIDTLNLIANSEPSEIELVLTKDSLAKMNSSREFINKIVEKEEPVYGINTGFGALSSKFIKKQDLAKLQVNLIRSHCTGVGKPFSKKVTRAIMVLRANCLSSGFSGINPEIVQLLLDFIKYGITPIVPEKGSVGASGDLAPLAHIALCLIGEGDVDFQGRIINSKVALDEIGKNPAILGPKDGLALINGTAVMTALGALALYEARNLFKVADIACCLTLDGIKGTSRAFSELITSVKPHLGQRQVCENLNKIIKNSEINCTHEACSRIQDPYSLRCVPQVHGACRQTFVHAWDVINIELNAVTDNPLVFVESKEVISGGNFHGEALALCMDYLAMGLAEICNISERRVEKMMNHVFSELPDFLVEDSGLNSGLMITHVTAAALVSENKPLCHPASVDSVPTSTDKEDHVSMGVTAGRKLHEVLSNTKYCLAIELLCAAQAIEFQRPLKSSPALEDIHKLIREHVEPIKEDRVFGKDIEKIFKLIDEYEIVSTFENSNGELQ